MAHGYQKPVKHLPTNEKQASLFERVVMGGVMLATIAAAWSAFGLVAMLGTAAVAGVGMAAWQQHKKSVNRENAHRKYAQTPGYHHEPEKVKDRSLMHIVQGPSDLPERVNYIEEHYGVKPMNRSEFKAKHHTTVKSLLAGGAAGLATAAVVGATFGTPFGIPLAAFVMTLAPMAGITAFSFIEAGGTNDYSAYVDKFAAEAKAARDAQRQMTREHHYDNGASRTRTFAADVHHSRGHHRHKHPAPVTNSVTVTSSGAAVATSGGQGSFVASVEASRQPEEQGLTRT